MRHTHFMTWSMTRNTEKRGKLELHTVQSGIWRKKPDECEKGVMHTVWSWIWQEILKKLEN